MDAVWQWAVTALIGVGSGIGSVMLATATEAGRKLVAYPLDARLHRLQHDQNAQIENLRTQLARVGDRNVRTNEREYAALIKAWEQYVDANRATLACVVRLMTYPAFSQMDDETTRQYLATTNFDESQREYVMRAERKEREKVFARIARMLLINTAVKFTYEARSTLEKQSVFIPESIEMKLEAALKILSQAQTTEGMDFDYGYMQGVTDKRGPLLQAMEQDLPVVKKMVRDRIGAVL